MTTPQQKKKNIAITGCSGFIGSHILERLLATTDYHVYGIDISESRIRHLMGNKLFTFCHQDIADTAKIRDILSQCGTVVSLAALCNPSLYNTKPVDVITINFTNALGIIKTCCEFKCRLIQFSTCEVYGKTLAGLAGSKKVDDYILKEDQTNLIMGPVSTQRWCYASAKQLLERIIYAYGFEHGLNYTIVRPFNFIGPKMDYIPGFDGEGIPRVLACFMKSLLFNEPLKLVDGGLSQRCFTFIEDAIDAFMQILENPEISNRQIFNVGNPKNEIAIKDLAYLMIELYKQIAPRGSFSAGTEIISSLEFYGKGYEDSDRRVPDISKIQNMLGWKPEINLRKALQITIEYYIRKYGIKERN
jgi:UDP-apiose/xylose synthase